MSEEFTVIKGHFYSERYGFNNDYNEEELKHFVGIPFSSQRESIKERCEHRSSAMDRLIRQARESINRRKDLFVCFTLKSRPNITIICKKGERIKAFVGFAGNLHPTIDCDLWLNATMEVVVFRSGTKEENIMRHVFLLEPLKI